jgi:hypothetical protein
LLKNRKVVELGACISISNRLNIDVWNSHWIPTLPNFKPRPNVNLLERPPFTVAELILPGVRAWNSQLLYDLFDTDSVQNILNIHIPQVTSFDKWSWAPSPSGLFSVKSAHELVSASSSGRTSPFCPEVWFMLWGLKLQARLKHLLWKIAWDILPSRTNIGRFVSSVDLNSWVCPFYKGPQETLSHLFLECDLDRLLWWNSPWPLITSSLAARPIADWIAAIVNPAVLLAIPRKEVQKFQIFPALTLDFIWLSRNKLIFEGLKPDPVKASKMIATSLELHLSAWSALFFILFGLLLLLVLSKRILMLLLWRILLLLANLLVILLVLLLISFSSRMLVWGKMLLPY